MPRKKASDLSFSCVAFFFAFFGWSPTSSAQWSTLLKLKACLADSFTSCLQPVADGQ